MNSPLVDTLSSVAGLMGVASSLPQIFEAARSGLPRLERLDFSQALSVALRVTANLCWCAVGLCLGNQPLVVACLFQVICQGIVLAALYKAAKGSRDPPRA